MAISIDKRPMTIQIGRNAAYGHVDVNCDKFPPHVNEFIYDYGLRQILNDTVSQKDDKDGNRLTNAEIFAKAQKKYEQLLAGELRAPRGSADPVEAIAWQMAKDEITTYLQSKKCWPKGKGKDKLQTAINARMKQLKKESTGVDEYVEAWLKQRPELLVDAKAELDRRQKARDRRQKAKVDVAAKAAKVMADAGL